MTKDEIIDILVEEYGWSFDDLRGKTHKALENLLSIEKHKEKHTEKYNPFSGLDGSSDPNDGADILPNGRDLDAEDEDSWS